MTARRPSSPATIGPPVAESGRVSPVRVPAAASPTVSGEAVGLAGSSPAAPMIPQGDNGAAGSPRTWRIELPAGLKVLSQNQRLHWAERNRRSQALKKAAWAMALNAHLPHLGRAGITVEYQPPDHRHRDADNAATASGKPCIDGLVAAGVLTDDESPRYVTEVTYRIGEPCPKGRIVLHVTEAVGGAA